MTAHIVLVGQQVTIGGQPKEWLAVERAEGKRLRVRRTFGGLGVQSARFWVDADIVNEVRWPIHAAEG